MTERLPLSYVLPLRSAGPVGAGLEGYLAWLGTAVDDLIVVDASPEPTWSMHHARWDPRIRHVPPADARRCLNGKVHGVLTGLDLACWDRVVIADDDVRYDEPGLRRCADLLSTWHLVAPQNYYAPNPWHTRYDTARTLVQRALAHDFPGTLVVRRSALGRSGGYDGDVLFENLELIRTVQALGGRVRWAPDVYVRRVPPTPRHLLGQRVRQAYDEFSRPPHLLAALAVLPLTGWLVAGRRWPALGGAAGVVSAIAEYGRRRAGGARYFPAVSSLCAPLWVLERGVCMWLALLHRARGGVPYGGRRLRRAANSPRAIARAMEAAA